MLGSPEEVSLCVWASLGLGQLVTPSGCFMSRDPLPNTHQGARLWGPATTLEHPLPTHSRLARNTDVDPGPKAGVGDTWAGAEATSHPERSWEP